MEVGKKDWEKQLQGFFQQYRQSQGTFGHARWNLEIDNDPRRPWIAMRGDPQYRTLADMALGALSVPTGIGAVERSVSTLRSALTSIW